MNSNIFQCIDDYNVAYWLGFIAADGCIRTNTSLEIGLASRDKEHLQKFKDFLNAPNSIIDFYSHCSTNDKYYPTSSLIIYNSQIIQDLAKYNIVSQKSSQDINFLQNIPEKYKLAFIFGLFDGDGWFVNAKSCGFGFCGNYQTVNNIREYLIEYFHWDNWSIHNYKKSLITYHIETQSVKKIKDFINQYLLYKDKCDLLERKFNIALEINERTKKQEYYHSKKIEKKKRKCLICEQYFIPAFKEQKYCSQECVHISQRKADRPSREELKKLIRDKSFLEIGRMYNVTDNAIRKWCKSYNLPHKKTEIKLYSNEDWDKI